MEREKGGRGWSSEKTKTTKRQLGLLGSSCHCSTDCFLSHKLVSIVIGQVIGSRVVRLDELHTEDFLFRSGRMGKDSTEEMQHYNCAVI